MFSSMLWYRWHNPEKNLVYFTKYTNTLCYQIHVFFVVVALPVVSCYHVRSWRQAIVLLPCRHQIIPTSANEFSLFAMSHLRVWLLSPYHAQPTRLRIVDRVEFILRAAVRWIANRRCLVLHDLLFPYSLITRYPVNLYERLQVALQCVDWCNSASSGE